MDLPVKNIKGEVVDTVQVSDEVFGVPMNKAVVHQAMVMYQQNKRQGTHSTKTRAHVSGGGRKPWAQKYTGRARQGSIRSPQWRHGGVVFGPHPRDHSLDMPRRMRHRALKCVLSDKVRSNKLVILDDLSLEKPSAKAMVQIMGDLGVTSPTLILTSEPQRNVVLSSHNLKNLWTLPVSLVNAEQLLKRDLVMMTLEAERRAEELWAVEKPKPRAINKLPRAASNNSDEAAEGAQVGA